MDSQKLKFLIAEDEFLIAMELKRQIEEMSYEVTSLVSTALEAITQTETDKPDIILMDVMLSGSLNGIEAARIISYKSNIPVIFLTNDDNFPQINLNTNSEIIRKPVDTQALYQTIKDLISRTSKVANNISQPPSFIF